MCMSGDPCVENGDFVRAIAHPFRCYRFTCSGCGGRVGVRFTEGGEGDLRQYNLKHQCSGCGRVIDEESRVQYLDVYN